MKLAPTIIILSSLLTAGTIHAKWSRIPIIKEKPVNAIAGIMSEASLDSSSGVGHADSIFSTDITSATTVSPGKSFVVVKLGKPVLISSSTFVNDGIEGKATLSASADKNGWAVLAEKVFSAADRDVDFKFAGMQAKFVKLELALSKGGTIRHLQFFGALTDKGVIVRQSPDGKGGKPMDLINGLGGARVIYAAPKPANGLDNAITYNTFSFPESDEKYRTVIYDFGQLRILNEFASLHSPRPVRFEVFAFDNLPEKEDWRGRMAFDPSDFGSVAPVAVAEDTRGLGELKARPRKPVKTRYLAMRWEPEFNPPDFTVDGSSAIGNANTIVNGTQVTVTNGDGTKSVQTVQVGGAHGAGASTNPVPPDNSNQQQAQQNAGGSDTAQVIVQTFAPNSPPGTPPISTTIAPLSSNAGGGGSGGGGLAGGIGGLGSGPSTGGSSTGGSSTGGSSTGTSADLSGGSGTSGNPAGTGAASIVNINTNNSGAGAPNANPTTNPNASP